MNKNNNKEISAGSAPELFKKAADEVNDGAKVTKIYISKKRGIFKLILKIFKNEDHGN